MKPTPDPTDKDSYRTNCTLYFTGTGLFVLPGDSFFPAGERDQLGRAKPTPDPTDKDSYGTNYTLYFTDTCLAEAQFISVRTAKRQVSCCKRGLAVRQRKR